MKLNILAHTAFIGETGYAYHARMFFTALSKYHNVKVRNYTIGKSWNSFAATEHDKEFYLTDEHRNMLILQTLYDQNGHRSDYPLYDYDNSFIPDVHIVLMDINHHYFYDNYDGYKIAYNVWESTEYPQDFFNKLLEFDELWVPSEWQKQISINQGYPEDRIFVVPEGVDAKTFKPIKKQTKKDKFRFLLFGRWEYRKSTTEILKSFEKVFGDNDDVELICSVENYYALDGLKNTAERFTHYNITSRNIKSIGFVGRDEYVKYLQEGDVFLSCARSEGFNLPLIEALACGTPSVYSCWGAQLEYADSLGIPINVLHEVPAYNQDPSFVGNYIEPDFSDLEMKMFEVYKNFNIHKTKAIKESQKIRNNFNWDVIAEKASERLKTIKEKSFVFVTTGNMEYMPLIEKMVKSLNEFSTNKVIVYGINCEVPFTYPNLIKRTLSPPIHSQHDKWYWKQYACIASIDEGFGNYVWIDGDAIVNYNIDNIQNYFTKIDNYPISDIHRNEEFYGRYVVNSEYKSQRFNENLCNLYGIRKNLPYAHVCLYIYNEKCKWWFEEIINIYKSIDSEDYVKYLLWNDEGIDNLLRWKYGFRKYLPLSNFDTSSYDGDFGQTSNQLIDFHKFWSLNGPYNFNKIYGFQFIPENKNQILYFHGNKNVDILDHMIDFIKLKKDDSFYQSEYFYVDDYIVKNLGEIKNLEGSTMYVAYNYGWDYAIYHEIYNLQDYYLDRVKSINEGDIVVDLGANIGIFNRWAYSQGAEKVISFEPDKRYFNLLSKNANPKSILFNAAIADKIGVTELYESSHLGGSNIINNSDADINHYQVRTYTLDYLFNVGLIDRIDFLKVDIEGAEIMALMGISDENLKKVKTIAIEYHNAHLKFDNNLRDDLILRLQKNGFNFKIIFLDDSNILQYIYFSKASILDEIGKKYNTDKSSIIHNYLKKYEKYLKFNRSDKLKILEIGVLHGSSLRTWAEYFYNSQIIGIDINPECITHREDRINVEIGSQFDQKFLEYVGEKYEKFDMILDDGSHINEHVIFTFKNLFKYVKSGGVYIIEDSSTSYWEDYGGGSNAHISTISFFKTLIDEVNFFGELNLIGPNVHSRDDNSLLQQFKNRGDYYIGLDIESIIFLNSIILINKR